MPPVIGNAYYDHGGSWVVFSPNPAVEFHFRLTTFKATIAQILPWYGFDLDGTLCLPASCYAVRRCLVVAGTSHNALAAGAELLCESVEG